MTTAKERRDIADEVRADQAAADRAELDAALDAEAAAARAEREGEGEGEGERRARLKLSNGTVITGESGDILVRDSWLINPADVTEFREVDGGVMLITTKGNFSLSKEEAEPFRPASRRSEIRG